MEQRIYKAACYCRLSDDDLNDGISISIETQKIIATQYCKANRIQIVDFYCDDGYTGTNFERPAFKRMIGDIEKGKVDTVIVKDLSRFGRESIMVNFYTQMFFPENKINFIIIADNTVITPDSSYDCMLTIKSAINEIYPAEVSQKVRQAFKAKTMNGEFLHAFVPYGYKRSATQRNHLVIDEKNAEVIRNIFEMVAYKGMGMKKIAQYLYENKIPNPSALHDLEKGITDHPDPYSWGISTLNSILHNEVYLGHIIYGKKKKVNFKSKKIVTTDKKQWVICENAHEPIVSQELWDAAHSRLEIKRKERKPEFEDNIYRSLLVCGDCGGTMWITSPPKKSTFFICANSKGRKAGVPKCTTHNIPLDDLNAAVIADINAMLNEYKMDSDGFREKLISRVKDKIPDADQIKNEIAELEKLIERESRKFRKIYDDYYDGIIKNAMIFEQMSESCNERIGMYTSKKEQLESDLRSLTDSYSGIDNFIELMSRFSAVKVLDREILNTLIDKIEVCEREKDKSDNIIQKVRIKYKFIGQVS